MPDLNRDLRSPRRYLDTRPAHGQPRPRGRPDRQQPGTHPGESHDRDENAEVVGDRGAEGGREERP
jgi:hypothetical protein